jgi:hypothetical protein
MIVTIILLLIICILFILLLSTNSKNNKETFDGITDLEKIDKNPVFVNLYDNKGNKLNVTLISKPFGGDTDFKQYLVNKPNKIYLGISSYMEFPYLPSNNIDNYVDIKDKIEDKNLNNRPSYYNDMYLNICEGWLHCFKDINTYLPTDKPKALISESDFVNYRLFTPDDNVKKEYDYVYSCPKVNEQSSCNDWVSYNKNWPLAEKCIKIMSDMGLKGLLIGRKGCDVPKNCETTGWVDFNEMKTLYNKSKFLFLPNVVDASPRMLTECLSMNLPCLVNENILGGWKYVSEETGEFFTDENNFKEQVQRLLDNFNKYTPRQYILNNYGPINSGRKLKEFLYSNYGDRINIPENEVDYISIRFSWVDGKF